MKRILIIPIITYILLPTITHAQNPSASSNILNQFQGVNTERPLKTELNEQTPKDRNLNIEEKRMQFEERKGELKSKLEVKRGEIQQKIEERKQNIAEKRIKLKGEVKNKVENILGNVYDRLNQIIQKLNNLAIRLNTKIDSLEQEGVNTGNAKSLLSLAQEKIDAAISELEASKSALDTSLETEVSKGDVRSTIDSLKSSIKSAHLALVEVVKEIKGLKANTENNNLELEFEATSTAQ